MDFAEVLARRHTTGRFSQRPVERELLLKVAEDAARAPKKPLGKLLTIKETGAPVKGEQW